ncbi:Sensor histidine kinase YycG [Pseudobythopirellula maris]|uniref:histidine kinase n=1 Tax=Pseudobythopirellula maris TaxID=2527991 RepID=A0A5C5ZN51_9BACT|nr:ATP-binding protein [Pseudobythopirellula maris]TWT88912.1 Sensor histidine kinase YycG [Pseudobythopirellula maris]
MRIPLSKNPFSRQPLARRVVAYYLFFCVAAVAWLLVGSAWTSYTLHSQRVSDSCLARLGQTAATVKVALLRDNADKSQRIADALHQLQRSVDAKSCSVVDTQGKFAAHTDPDRVGEPVGEPVGERKQWGAIETIRYEGANGRYKNEYRAALSSDGAALGELRLTVDEMRGVDAFSMAVSNTPTAVLAPLVLIFIGALALVRMTRPLDEMQDQLTRAARTSKTERLELDRLRPATATALGWNRLVEELSEKSTAEPAAPTPEVDRRRSGFEEIVQGLSDGVAVTDAAGRVEFANRAIAALLGAEELSDQSLVELLGDAAPSADTACRRTVSELRRGEGEAERVLRVARQPLTEGKAGRALWSLRDVTQQKLVEQARDQFIDTATHELRTPLSNIRAYSETLATGDVVDLEAVKEFCTIINSEATRLGRFVDDLLTISSLEVGALTIERHNVMVDRLLSEAAMKAKPLMEQKQIEFEVQAPAKPIEMKLDKDKIAAAITNLLGNAAKYTPEGGHVSLKATAQGGELRIAVADTGLGIGEDEHTRVFEKFFRSADERVRDTTGTGLGLPLAREVARLHDGDITLESKIGQGSTFTLTLPIG